MSDFGKEKVLQIITKALELKEPATELDDMKSLEEWDSLGHLAVLTYLDKEFDGRAASIQDLASSDSAQKIIAILARENLI